MSGIPEEKVFTREQLLDIMSKQRREMEEFLKTIDLPETVGKEMLIDTEEGQVRVLTYNMENPKKLPLLVNLHGSGFVIGHAEMDDPFMMNIAEKANIKIMNVDYSLAPENPFPKALDECYAVMKYAKEHGDELGIDPERIAVGGHSAGGNFSAALCIMDGEKNEVGIKCAILDYPPLDVYTSAYQKPNPKGAIPPETSVVYDACYHNDKEGRKNSLISPIYAVKDQLKTFPPTLIITAGYDSLCGEAQKFRMMLADTGVDVTYHCFEKNLHGFTHQQVPEAEQAWQMMIDYLKKYL